MTFTTSHMLQHTWWWCWKVLMEKIRFILEFHKSGLGTEP